MRKFNIEVVQNHVSAISLYGWQRKHTGKKIFLVKCSWKAAFREFRTLGYLLGQCRPNGSSPGSDYPVQVTKLLCSWMLDFLGKLLSICKRQIYICFLNLGFLLFFPLHKIRVGKKPSSPISHARAIHGCQEAILHILWLDKWSTALVIQLVTGSKVGIWLLESNREVGIWLASCFLRLWLK